MCSTRHVTNKNRCDRTVCKVIVATAAGTVVLLWYQWRMSVLAPITYMLICPGCRQMGMVTWEEPRDEQHRFSRRKMVELEVGFRVERRKPKSVGDIIVCSNCDTVQPD